MSDTSPTISIRLPRAARESLDHAAMLTRRSRSFLMQAALERHLQEIIREQTQGSTPRRYATLQSLAGAGRRSGEPRSAEEIDNHIRWLRDND